MYAMKIPQPETTLVDDPMASYSPSLDITVSQIYVRIDHPDRIQGVYLLTTPGRLNSRTSVSVLLS